MRQTLSALVSLLCFSLALSYVSGDQEEREPSSQRKASISFSLMDLSGNIYTLGQNDLGRIRVFVFLSTSCPIANSYTPELNRLSKALPQNVEFYGVFFEPTVTRFKAAQHASEYKFEFPVLFDASGLLAEALMPTHVPEAFVLNEDGVVHYRGAIDNAYESIGRRRVNVEHHFLKDAIAAVAQGQAPEVPFSKPVGCVNSKKLVRDTSSITFNRDVAPIIQSRCMNCHRPGQVAPFALTNYGEVLEHADMIVEVTHSRIMPPWMPGDSEATDEVSAQPKFVGDRRLADRELEVLDAWTRGGCIEGDLNDLPPAPQFAEGWQLGTPDLVAKMSESFSVPASGPDLLQNFVIPLSIPEDKLVAAIEFHPGNKRVVHHAVLFLDDKGQARRLDQSTPEPGYQNFGGPGFLPSGALGGWSVGNTARRLPNEMGRYLKKGSDLVVQVHYHPTGKEEVDQSEIGLYFVNKPVAQSLAEPAKLVGSIWMANYEMDIAAGEKAYRRSSSYRLPKDVTLVGLVPHMHLLGKSMSVVASLPDGTKRSLINVPNWNYNWQDEYYLEKPFQLPAKTVLEVTATFDNSSGNPSNPSSPPQRVTWGEETTDEMLFCFFLLTTEKPEDLIHVIFDNLQHDINQTRGKK